MFRVSPIATVGFWVALVCSSACSSGAQPDSASTSMPEAGVPMGSVGCVQAGADVYLPGMKKPGSGGLYDFELVSSSPAPPALNDNTFVLEVTDAEGNPVNGELSVALDMPEHGHPSPEQPRIDFDPATAAFSLNPMRLFMVGLWRLTFGITTTEAGAATTDSTVFKFCID